jgi:hypothetical protein
VGRGRCVRERHAFDADHIAAIDNTTRKLLADGRRPVSAGFWFALGHLTIVVVLAAGIAAGVRFIVGLTADGSSTRVDLGVVSTSASGLFLYLIGILNLVALVGIARVYRQARAGGVRRRGAGRRPRPARAGRPAAAPADALGAPPGPDVPGGPAVRHRVRHRHRGDPPGWISTTSAS